MSDFDDFAYEITAGDTWSEEWDVSQGGAVQNIASGWSFRFTGKEHLSDTDGDALFQKTVGDGVTITNGAGGIITTALVPDDTSAIDKKTPLYVDLQAKNGSNVYTVARGMITVLPQVTRSA